jgi:hypothetical protein
MLSGHNRELVRTATIEQQTYMYNNLRCDEGLTGWLAYLPLHHIIKILLDSKGDFLLSLRPACRL